MTNKSGARPFSLQPHAGVEKAVKAMEIAQRSPAAAVPPAAAKKSRKRAPEPEAPVKPVPQKMQVNVHPDMLRTFKRIAFDNNTTVKDIVTNLLVTYLREEGYPEDALEQYEGDAPLPRSKPTGK